VNPHGLTLYWDEITASFSMPCVAHSLQSEYHLASASPVLSLLSSYGSKLAPITNGIGAPHHNGAARWQALAP